MLKELRKKKTAKKLLWFLAIVIIPAFVLWGFGSFFSDTKEPKHAGTFEGKKIPFKEFKRNFEAVAAQIKLNFYREPQKINTILENIDMPNLAWDRTIILRELKKHYIEVSDTELLEYIASIPLFIRSRGFDKNLYYQTIMNYLQIPVKVFEESLRDNIAIMKLKDRVTAGVKINDQEIWEEFVKQNREIKIDYIIFEPVSYEKDVEISPEEIQKYYDEHKNEFRLKKQINLKYALIPEEKKELVEKVEDNLNEGFSIEEVAKNNGLEIKETGYFGKDDIAPGIGFAPELNETIFDLNENEIAPLIKASKNWVLFVVIGKRENYLPSFSEVEEKINGIIKQNKTDSFAKAKAMEMAKNIKDISGSKGFNVEIKETPFFTMKDYIEGIGMASELKNKAYKMKIGELSDIVKTDKGYCIFQIVDSKEPSKDLFEKEKQKTASTLMNEKREILYQEWLINLRKKAVFSPK